MDILLKIPEELGLGPPLEPPRPLRGGFMHRMYTLFTDRGQYAVKLLNPHIMARPDAMANFRRAEALESMLEQTDLPILPALTFRGRKMQESGGQFFYLYEYFDGCALKSDEITIPHCRRIGEILARIHGIERCEATFEREPLAIDWDDLITRLAANHPGLHALLAANRDLLYELQARANEAFPKVPAVQTICHGDMDSKNVLWHESDCRVIDLECLGRSNPYIELYELALCWSGLENCSVDIPRFRELISAYASAGGILPADWTVIHDANCGRLEWLEYNVLRSMGIGCSESEIPIGVSEVQKTMAQISCYRRIRNRLTF